MRPACFDSEEQWAYWMDEARKSLATSHGQALRRHGHCVDCTPEYQAKMKAQGRCEFPLVCFRIRKTAEGDHELQGWRDLYVPAQRTRKRKVA